MEVLLEEHGDVILYGLVGIIMIIIICTLIPTKWKNITPNYNTQISKTNQDMKGTSNQAPTIIVDEIIYANYKNSQFKFRDFIKAIDEKGNDISRKVNVYGNVDVYKRGIYKLRCIVMADNSMTCTKYVNVIVE